MSPAVESAASNRVAVPAQRIVSIADYAAPHPDPTVLTVVGCRLLSIILAVVLLVLTAPLMAAIAIAVWLSSPGPILYSQMRVGIDRRSRSPGGWDARRRVNYGGRLFRIYKFRTMFVDQGAAQQWAAADDPRITRVGRVLRQFRLDELPQLWNVLRGDMNVVGPRPEQPNIFLSLREQIADYPHRQRVLPGITGLAQISQSYDRCVEDVREKVRHDLRYIETLSPLRDLHIVLSTIPVVFFRRGGW